jgi:hypothetical protein
MCKRSQSKKATSHFSQKIMQKTELFINNFDVFFISLFIIDKEHKDINLQMHIQDVFLSLRY